MHVIFVRHATAEDFNELGDKARQLTRGGQREADATAAALSRLGVPPEVILVSPLVRAVRTGRALGAVFKKAAFDNADFLAPPGNFKAMKRRLLELYGQGCGAAALVGHRPSLDELLSRLAAGIDDIGLKLSKAGAACVVLPPHWPAEAAVLQWVMHRDQLALIAKKG